MKRLRNAVYLVGLVSLMGLLLGGPRPAHGQTKTGQTKTQTKTATVRPPKIRVDFQVVKRGARYAVAIVLTNTTKKTIVGYHPQLQMAVGFIVLDSLGNIVTPVGIGKVSPKRQRLRLGPKATKTIWLGWKTPAKLTLPYLSGSALFGYRLARNVPYRVIALYRPQGHLSRVAFTSREKRLVLE
jgi:hypothetical protein